MEKSLDELRAELEQAERKAAQYEHRVQRLENRLSYKENRSRKERAHRLITRGAAIESILPQVKGLSEVQFYSLMFDGQGDGSTDRGTVLLSFRKKE